jgi:hypothetical protein
LKHHKLELELFDLQNQVDKIDEKTICIN